jgi:hypothetical protein
MRGVAVLAAAPVLSTLPAVADASGDEIDAALLARGVRAIAGMS